MPKFSIIIPVYNVEEYIGRCLDSVFKQNNKDFEVIVVDDGCTDQSIEIAKEFAVKIVSTEHVSVSEARNLGAKQARGNYLLFLDSDDYWDNNLLEEITKSLSNNPDLVRFQVRTVTDTGEITDYKEMSFENKTGVEAFSIISKFHFVESVWCYAIKREYYEEEKSVVYERLNQELGKALNVAKEIEEAKSLSEKYHTQANKQNFEVLKDDNKNKKK